MPLSVFLFLVHVTSICLKPGFVFKPIAYHFVDCISLRCGFLSALPLLSYHSLVIGIYDQRVSNYLIIAQAKSADYSLRFLAIVSPADSESSSSLEDRANNIVLQLCSRHTATWRARRRPARVSSAPSPLLTRTLRLKLQPRQLYRRSHVWASSPAQNLKQSLNRVASVASRSRCSSRDARSPPAPVGLCAPRSLARCAPTTSKSLQAPHVWHGFCFHSRSSLRFLHHLIVAMVFRYIISGRAF